MWGRGAAPPPRREGWGAPKIAKAHAPAREQRDGRVQRQTAGWNREMVGAEWNREMGGAETDRQTERQRDSDKQTETDRRRDGRTERRTDKETDGQGDGGRRMDREKV